MPVEAIVDGVIDLVQKNLAAETNVSSNIVTGDTIINVNNTFQYKKDQEIILIDWHYSDQNHSHYSVMEYARIKEVNNTTSLTLTDPVVENWSTTDSAYIQKTIGHSPLHSWNVFFGDREVIPFEHISVTVEPVSVSNEWIYIQGGLSEEYTLRILIYGKSPETEEGIRILVKYADAIYQTLNDRVHFDVAQHNTPILSDVSNGASTFVVADTVTNRDKFVLSSELPDVNSYFLQDNLGIQLPFSIIGKSIGGGEITLTMGTPATRSFILDEYASAFRMGGYIYDSRTTAITYGAVQKGSAIVRVAELDWFGKTVNEHNFPQQSHVINNFEKIIP
tara:strand:+ start:74572 stop:75576 length:1005 start_codon:yes stop_codon:yes gene_type:complete